MKPTRRKPLQAALVPAFRLVANLEALSWAGLLVGMTFKYLVASRAGLGEELVTVFGSLHGGLVIVYVALACAVALRLRWRLGTAALAVAATLPPFATVVFDLLAHRKGLYASRHPA